MEDKSSCSCNSTDFGCCPDGKKTARGLDNLGCGCAFSEFGCCYDQVTEATGPDQVMKFSSAHSDSQCPFL